MKGKEENTQGQERRASIGNWVKILIPAAFALAGVVFSNIYTNMTNWKIQKSKEAQEEKMWQLENGVEQRFLNVTTVVKRAEITYIRYELMSDPALGGYHAIAYPYLAYGAEERIYIPVVGQFTQKEYAADEQGCCQMFKENVTDELLEVLAEISPFPIEAGCLVAIEYVEEEREVREIYVIRDGELTIAEQELAVEVLEAWEKMEERSWIDMSLWPCVDRGRLQEIF